MKQKLLIFSLAICMGLFSSMKGFSQDTTSAGEDLKHAAQKTGKAVGHKTAQVAASTKAVIKDKVYEGKVSPGGHRVYIDKHAKYYWIDKKGRKHFVTEAQLTDKS